MALNIRPSPRRPPLQYRSAGVVVESASERRVVDIYCSTVELVSPIQPWTSKSSVFGVKKWLTTSVPIWRPCRSGGWLHRLSPVTSARNCRRRLLSFLKIGMMWWKMWKIRLCRASHIGSILGFMHISHRAMATPQYLVTCSPRASAVSDFHGWTIYF